MQLGLSEESYAGLKNHLKLFLQKAKQIRHPQMMQALDIELSPGALSIAHVAIE